MKVALYILSCIVWTHNLQAFGIRNNSESPKQVDVLAFLPQKNGENVPTIILKKTLMPHEKVEAPFALKEVVLDVHWGNKTTTNPDHANWKLIENNNQEALAWQTLGIDMCGKQKRPCHIVIPSTWQLYDTEKGFHLKKDTGEIVTAATKKELYDKIPYRRLVDSFPQKQVIESEPQKVQTWKKISKNPRTADEVVIPSTWSLFKNETEWLIITDKGATISIPIHHIERIDSLGQKHAKIIADEMALKKAIPFRRDHGVITERQEKQRIFVIEKVKQKPITSTQFNLFRRFAAQEAEASPLVPGVPETLSNDHIIEIAGTDSDIDMVLLYAPEGEEKALRRKHTYEIANEEEFQQVKRARY